MLIFNLFYIQHRTHSASLKDLKFIWIVMSSHSVMQTGEVTDIMIAVSQQ